MTVVLLLLALLGVLGLLYGQAWLTRRQVDAYRAARYRELVVRFTANTEGLTAAFRKLDESMAQASLAFTRLAEAKPPQ